VDCARRASAPVRTSPKQRPLLNQRANALILRINFATISYALEYKQAPGWLNAAEPANYFGIFKEPGASIPQSVFDFVADERDAPS
jgi:hypothetical protein